MGKVKIPLLLLHIEVGEKWLERCHEKVLKQLIAIDTEYRPGIPGILSEGPLKSKEFIMFNYTNINSKYAKLIAAILKYNQVVGIWKEYLIGTEVIRIVKIYGYKGDLILANNMLHYLLNGFDRYFDNHVKELRRKRQLRRNAGKRIVKEIDARKRTNMNIMHKVRTLENIITNFKTPFKSDNALIKENIIIKHILEHVKLDLKTYRGMKRPTVKSVTSRKGIIQINRII